MGAGDRRADTLGVVDDRVTLGAEFVDEAANAQFVVGEAPLQRVHFGMHERLELGGAGDGALDAFVHRRDFAAHGLADAHDALGGDGFRIGQAKRHLGHRAGGGSEILGARHHDREGEEQHDGDEDADRERDDAGRGKDAFDRGDLPELVAVDHLPERDAAHRPEDRDDHRIADRRAHRAAFQRAKDRRRTAFARIVGGLECRGLGSGFGGGRSV